VRAVDLLYLWTDRVLFVGLVALRVWALLDCITRNAKAFPAVDKLTKPAWLGILALSLVLGTVAGPVTWPISLISAVITVVYLADVRPAVRDITSGR
jgi:Protein of unknown function (DUF2516)